MTYRDVVNRLRIGLAILLLAALLSAPGWAAGPKGHEHGSLQAPLVAQHPDQDHGHVAAIRKMVPEDYRIMERTPVIDSRESLLAGRKLFVFHCAVCHGSLGRGDGAGASGLKTPPADFLDFAHSALYPPGVKYWLIAKGDQQVGMPGFPKLAPKEIWHMVNYLLALQAKVKSEGYDSAPHKGH